MANPAAPEARWWTPQPDGRILCTLCPRDCRIAEGQRGFCYIRKNEGGRLVSLGYGRPSALQIDPIEKKPLYHFLPGSTILSLGTAGCNLGCRFCQNWDLTKAGDAERRALDLPPDKAVDLAVAHGAPSIAFTYNDPTVFAEYAMDTAMIARERGIKTVMVTAGYIREEPFREVYRHIDAANVDLKAFSEDFYRKLAYARLQPVLDTLLRLRRETSVWVEITNLVIPGENDSADEIRRLCAWVAENMGVDTPLHFSAYHPAFRFLKAPRTPESSLAAAWTIAREAGLRYAYVGNIRRAEGQATLCPRCGARVIERDWHEAFARHLRGGRCAQCGEPIAGVFESR
ncbi:MAG: pyruvate formate lyase-activating enzyme 1 [candidate division BRC1 bacterium ADurb.BinA364]|nr:MAG: pyruvate formate lyase-activating enzyme 1 [candidate division BRC1 bacterium ADurb.BinA364]